MALKTPKTAEPTPHANGNGNVLANKVVDQVMEGMKALNETVKTLDTTDRQVLTTLTQINSKLGTLAASIIEVKKAADDSNSGVTAVSTLMATINEQLARSPIRAFIMDSLRGFGGLMTLSVGTKWFSLVFWSLFLALTIWGVMISANIIALSGAVKEMKGTADAVVDTAGSIKDATINSGSTEESK